MDLNNTIEQVDLTDIHKTFHPTETEYTFSQAHTEHSLKQVIFGPQSKS